MSPSSDPRHLEASFAAKAVAEMRAADGLVPGSEAVSRSGTVFARVLLVKGLPGPAEASGGPALSGPDGEAAGKALEALGFERDDACAVLARPDPDADDERVAARVLRYIEAIDPHAVVALDRSARDDVARALGVRAPGFGRVSRAGGREIVALGGLEASLADETRKRVVWRQFKSLSPREPVW